MFKLGIFCPVLYIKKSHLALSLFFLLIKGRKKSVFSKVLKLRIGGRSVSVSAAIYDQLNQPPQICIRLLAEEILLIPFTQKSELDRSEPEIRGDHDIIDRCDSIDR